MNKLNGVIINVQSSQEMSIVEVDVEGDVFTAIVLETPRSAAYLTAGHAVEVIFKETEVSIAKDLSGLISIRNRFKARIKNIEQYELLTTIVLMYQGVEVRSIISTQSRYRLQLNTGQDVEWLVKTNEVSLCPTT